MGDYCLTFSKKSRTTVKSTETNMLQVISSLSFMENIFLNITLLSTWALLKYGLLSEQQCIQPESSLTRSVQSSSIQKPDRHVLPFKSTCPKLLNVPKECMLLTRLIIYFSSCNIKLPASNGS